MVKKNNVKSKIIEEILDQKPSKTDPDGSYTGKPENKKEKPVQDADDL